MTNNSVSGIIIAKGFLKECKMFGIKAKLTKGISGLLSAIILVVFFLSVAFIITEANHDCSGGDCPVCACIDKCVDFLGTSREPAHPRAEESFSTASISRDIPLFAYISVSTTPVSEKVQLND